MLATSRQIFVHGRQGVRQVKETLSDLLVGLVLAPDELWLVSPWVSDFDLLDNRSGTWDTVEPAWSTRIVRFSEVLGAAVAAGCNLKLVTNPDPMNRRFYNHLTAAAGNEKSIQRLEKETLHTKGLLCSSFLLAGSMNFTYSGTHRNDERVHLTIEPSEIADARIAFQTQYPL